MLVFHDGIYLGRTNGAWFAMYDERNAWANSRDLDAGYCLDAPDQSPAGATHRVDAPHTAEPFAAPVRFYARLGI